MNELHKDVIISNFIALVDETDLNTLVPELLTRNVLNGRMIHRILNPHHSLKRQKTDLYTEILKRGSNAFVNLVSSLECTGHLRLAQLLLETEISLKAAAAYVVDDGNDVEMMGTQPQVLTVSNDGGCVSADSRVERVPDVASDAQRVNHNDPPPNSNAQSARLGTRDPGIASDLNDYSLERPVDLNHKMFEYPGYMKKLGKAIESSEFAYSDNFIMCTYEKSLPVKVRRATTFQEQNSHGPPVYRMESNPRGLALIINNIDFHDSDEYMTRRGSENDEKRMKDLLEQLHYVVEVHQNKTKREMIEIVDRFSRREELFECDSVIVTLMSHGEEGDTEDNSKIVGVDGMSVAINDIVSYFYNDACRALINKPKVFFFQACRGALEDTGVLLHNFIPRGRIEKDSRHVPSAAPRRINIKIRSQSDIFIACPVPPGRKANRDRFTGTWFIQTIVDVFAEHAYNTHLEDMMKMVDLKIKDTNNFYTLNFQALTTKTIGWNKNLFFNPGLMKNKLTGEVVRLAANVVEENGNGGDEGMDVVDTPSDTPTNTLETKSSAPTSPMTDYYKLKGQSKGGGGSSNGSDNLEDGKTMTGCYNFQCNAI